MTAPRKPRSDAALNREHLIEVARRVLSDQPRASMGSIAGAAGLGRNTIHRHFPTRQDLLDAVRAHATDESAANEVDALRPPGELGSPAPSRLVVSEVLNKVPPFRLGEQIVAEAHRLPGVSSAAIYLVDLDGGELRRLAGADTFPVSIPTDVAVGPEIPRESAEALAASIRTVLPAVIVAPLHLRGRATGVLVALGTEHDHELRELAGVAAAALALADRYTDQGARTARARPTSPAAEIQQNMLPPRIVRVSGAMVAGNVTPGYEIGGDWFDYAENTEGTWLGIADTMGTGPRTTAVASVVLGAFRSERHRDDATPASVVRTMNDTIRELGDFAVPVAVTVAIWHGATGILQWVTCGTVRPVLLSAQGAPKILGEHNSSLGDGDLPRRLRIQSRHVKGGERVLFLSDGLLDRAASDGTAFGLAGVERAAIGGAGTSAAETVRAITDCARTYVDSSFQDDATVLVLAPSGRG